MNDEYQARLSIDLEVLQEAVTVARRKCALNENKGAIAILTNSSDSCARVIQELKQRKSNAKPREKELINQYVQQFMTIGYSILIGKSSILGRISDHHNARKLLLIVASELCVCLELNPEILSKPVTAKIKISESSDFRSLLVQALCLLGVESEFTASADSGNFYALAVEISRNTELEGLAKKITEQASLRASQPRRVANKQKISVQIPSPKGEKVVLKRPIQVAPKPRNPQKEKYGTSESFRALSKLPKHLIAHVIRQEIISVFGGNLDLAYGMLSRNEMNERELQRTLQALLIDWEALTGASDFYEIFRSFDIDNKGVIDAHDLLLFMPKHEEDEIRKLADKYFAMDFHTGPAWDPQSGLSSLLGQTSHVSDITFEELLKKFWEGQDTHLSWKSYLAGVEKQIRTDSSKFLAATLKNKVDAQIERAELTDGSARLTRQCKKILADLRSLVKSRVHLADLNKQLRGQLEEEEGLFSAMRLLARESKKKELDVDEPVPHHNLNDINDVFNNQVLEEILKKREQRKKQIHEELELKKAMKRKMEEEQLVEAILAEDADDQFTP